MHHFFDAITDNKGNALTGYYVRVTDSGGAGVSLYADPSLTPISSVSGVADTARVDSNGNCEFYCPVGVYTLNIYATDGITPAHAIANWDMSIDVDTAAAAEAAQAAASTSATNAANSASAAAASTSAAATSATNAANSATAAAGSATSAASSASAASSSATNSAESATQSAASAALSSSSYNAIAAAIAPGTLNNATVKAATRAILAGLSTTLPAYLTESGREGTFVFDSSNNSANVAADTQQWFYVAPATDTTGASGAWVRKRDAITIADSAATTGQALFTNLAGITVSPTVIRVRSLGYRTRGVGAADYIYDPAVDSAFVAAHPTWSFLAEDGRGFRIDYSSGSVPFDAFGAYGDRVTDDYPAWLAMQDFLLTTQIQLSTNPYYRHLIPVSFSPTAYHFGTRLDCKIGTFDLRGAPSPGIQNGGWGTVFEFAAGVGGLTLQDGQSMGETNDPTPQPNARGAYGSIISNILFISQGGTTTHHYGLWVRVGGCRLINVSTQEWGDHGCVVEGTSGATGDAAGGPNSTHIDGLISSHNNGCGLFVQGSDANAGDFRGIQCISNGTWGIYENSGLANVYIGGQMAGNGYAGSGRTVDTNVAAASACSYGGLWYFVVIGQAAAASTTVPGTNYTVWAQHPGTGGPTSAVPAWVSGMTWKEGGAAAVIGQSAPVTFVGLYTEGGQSPIQNPGGQGLFIGGTIGSQVYLNRGRLSALTGLVNVGLGMRSYNTIADPVAGVTDITVGGSPSTKQIRKLVQSADAPLGWIERFLNGDIQTIYQGSFTSHYITGPNTLMTFGRTAPVPYAFAPVALFTFNGRQISHGSAAPTTGEHARGDLCINTGPTAVGPWAWTCTTAGTPGTWTALYNGYGVGNVGYATGAGGTTTQATSKSTGVTLSKLCGQITMNAAALAAGAAVGFTLTNTQIAATDVVVVNIASGATANSYTVTVDAVAAGSCHILLHNISAGSLSEAVVLNVAVIKAVAA